MNDAVRACVRAVVLHGSASTYGKCSTGRRSALEGCSREVVTEVFVGVERGRGTARFLRGRCGKETRTLGVRQWGLLLSSVVVVCVQQSSCSRGSLSIVYCYDLVFTSHSLEEIVLTDFEIMSI